MKIKSVALLLPAFLSCLLFCGCPWDRAPARAGDSIVVTSEWNIKSVPLTSYDVVATRRTASGLYQLQLRAGDGTVSWRNVYACFVVPSKPAK